MNSRNLAQLGFGLAAFVLCQSLRLDPQSSLAAAEANAITNSWSESSPNARVGKSLLKHLTLVSVFQNLEDPTQPRWEMTDDFIRFYGLNPNQTFALSQILSNAQHKLRRIEGDHLVEMKEPANLGRYRSPETLKVRDQVSFELRNYSEPLLNLQNEIRRQLSEALGPTLATEFWRQAPPLVRGFGKYEPFIPNQPPQAEQTTHTIRLIEFNGRLSVDRVRVTRHWDPSGKSHGESTDGGPYFPSEDPFCPIPFASKLKGWRVAIQDYTRTNHVAPEKPIEGISRERSMKLALGSRAPSTPAGNNPKRWEDKTDFIEIPKEALPLLNLPTIRDHALTPELITVLDLSQAQASAVNALYNQLRKRFEALEKSQMTPIDPDKRKFLLKAFPDAANGLQVEWKSTLATLVGENRAKWLHTLILNQRLGPNNLPYSLEDIEDGVDAPHRWSSWLLRGTDDIELQVEDGPNIPNGPRVRFKLRNVGPPNTPAAAMRARPQPVETQKVIHLFNPEVFDLHKSL